MVERIVNGKDLAKQNKIFSHGEWVKRKSAALARAGRIEKPWRGKVCEELSQAVKARIDFGRWIADCPDCGGAEYVDPEEKIFFCLSCGNEVLDGEARQVIFPENREEIEALVLERPVKFGGGSTAVSRALLAKPIAYGYSRSWNPNETAEELKGQNIEILKLLAISSPTGMIPSQTSAKEEEHGI